MDLPKRKLNRLAGYDYSQNGAYFVTICTHERACLFGKVKNEGMDLNPNGLIVQANLEKIQSLYDGITVDKYVVMPNHVHIIMQLCRERIACVPTEDLTKSQLSKTIQVFKSSVTKQIRRYAKMRNAYNAFPTIWQTHFHDRIIRNEAEYQKIWQYIDTNPLKWEEDCFYK